MRRSTRRRASTKRSRGELTVEVVEGGDHFSTRRLSPDARAVSRGPIVDTAFRMTSPLSAKLS